MMTSPSGLPVNAVFGIARDLMALRERKPTYLVCAMDRPEPTFRSCIFPEYKAHRPEPPADLIRQFSLIEDLIVAMGIPLLSLAGFEADDLIATVATSAQARDLDCFICTSDKDCRQLLTEKTRLFNLRKGIEYGIAELAADWGIRPDQVVELQALVGDSADNVPGVPGIGYKTAAKLLQEFGTLANILANADKVAGAKKQEALRAAGPQVATSLKLVQLDRFVPIPITWDAWQLQEPDYSRLFHLFRDWGFRTLASQMEKKMPAGSSLLRSVVRPSPLKGKKTSQPSLFDGLDETPVPILATSDSIPQTLGPITNSTQRELFEEGALGDLAVVDPKWDYTGYQKLDSFDAFTTLVHRLKESKTFAIDLETTGLDPRDAEIVGISFCLEKGKAFYLPLLGPQGAMVLPKKMVLETLKPVLESPLVGKINQNIKYDLSVFAFHGINLAGIAGDPMIADYLLHAGERSHGLDELSKRNLNHRMIPISDLIGDPRKPPQRTMDQVPIAEVVRYACEDADAAWQLHEILFDQLKDANKTSNSSLFQKTVSQNEIELFSQEKLYKEVEIPLLSVLAAMEMRGIRIDTAHLEQLGKGMAEAINRLHIKIYELAGGPFDIQSLPQLRNILFKKMGLPTLKKTGITKEPSTDQETLEKLAKLDHPGAAITRSILELRKVSKLKSTYVDPLPLMVHPKTGRVHASFHQTVAATGRLSSSDPNLQNIPVRDDAGMQIRRAFLPAEGWDLWTADYSQIELRLLAHLSGDKELCLAYHQNEDIHTRVAAALHGVSAGEVTPAMRRVAKTVNFGVVYGISAHGLADRLGIARGEAEKFIEGYFHKYPGVLDYQERVLAEARQLGFVQTILGRRRRIEGVRPKSTFWQRNQPEREAINMVVQGSAADLIKMAMIGLENHLSGQTNNRENSEYRGKARLLMQIHDELVLEAPPEERPELAAIIQSEMVTKPQIALRLAVPLAIDLGYGPNWVDNAEVAKVT